jgi:hypothetical protein
MRTVLMLFAAMVFSCAQAQQSPSTAPGGKQPAAAPSPDQLEPAVNTSATAAPDAAPAGASAAASMGRLTPKGDKARAAGSAAAPKPAGAAGEASGPARAGSHGLKGPDRVELETTEITGNRELPKVLYIVPWKRSDLGDLVGKPANSLLDEALQPIDRDVFLRENRYYDAVKPDVPRPRAGPVPGSGDKP